MKQFVVFFIVVWLSFAPLSAPAFAQEERESSSPVVAPNRATSSPAPDSSEVVAPAPPTDPLNLTVSPVVINVETEPGKPVSSSLKVFNNGVATEYLELSLATFSASADGDKPVIAEFEANAEEKNWVTFSQPRFTAEPGVWKTIDFSFNPPETASLSYYYALVVKRQVQAEAQGGETAVQAAPAVLLVTTVNSPFIKRELQITDVKVRKMIYEFVPAEFEITVKNTGNVHVAPLGDVFIEQGSEKNIGIIPINAGRGLILPGSERTFIVRWEDGFPSYRPIIENGKELKDERGSTKYDLTWDFSNIAKFRLGRYVATILLVYDDGQRDVPLEALVSFWIIPWRLVVAALLVSLVLVSGLVLPFFLFVRRFKSKK